MFVNMGITVRGTSYPATSTLGTTTAEGQLNHILGRSGNPDQRHWLAIDPVAGAVHVC